MVKGIINLRISADIGRFFDSRGKVGEIGGGEVLVWNCALDRPLTGLGLGKLAKE